MQTGDFSGINGHLVTRALYLGCQSLPKWSTLCFLSFPEIWGFLSMSLRVFSL